MNRIGRYALVWVAAGPRRVLTSRESRLLSPASAHEILKQATADLHREVEAGFSALDLTVCGDYRRFLAAHALVIPAAERRLEENGIESLLPDWPERTRRRALAADLARLGAPPTDTPVNSEPLSPAGLLGESYVLEGSRLGAQVVLRMVTGSADPVIRETTSFLRHGSGERLWPLFLQKLNESVTDEAAIGEAVAAARGVFERFLEAQEVLLHREALVAGA